MLPLKDNIPTDRFPLITVLFIAINILIFGWQLSLDDDPNSSESPHTRGLSAADEAIFELGAIPYRLIHPGTNCGIVTVPAGTKVPEVEPVVCEGSADERVAEDIPGVRVVDLEGPPWWATVLTSMFMHGGWLHIIGNMLFLWVFGTNVEDSMGRLRFVLFYLLAGVTAVYAQSAINPDSTIPTIGASGAVAGVLGAYILLYPKARVVTLVIIIFFVTLIEIPAMILLAIWAFLQFLPALGQVGVGDLPSGSVAYVAHVGGFLFGMLAIKLFTAHRDERPKLGYG